MFAHSVTHLAHNKVNVVEMWNEWNEGKIKERNGQRETVTEEARNPETGGGERRERDRDRQRAEGWRLAAFQGWFHLPAVFTTRWTRIALSPDYVCVCVCVCAFNSLGCMFACMCAWLLMCKGVCVCVCVCVCSHSPGSNCLVVSPGGAITLETGLSTKQ